jgi:hypothetical protein
VGQKRRKDGDRIEDLVHVIDEYVAIVQRATVN